MDISWPAACGRLSVYAFVYLSASQPLDVTTLQLQYSIRLSVLPWAAMGYDKFHMSSGIFNRRVYIGLLRRHLYIFQCSYDHISLPFMTFRQLRRRYLPSWLRFLFAVRWQWQHMRVCRQYKRKHPYKHQCTMVAYCYPLYSVLLTVLNIVWLACINIGRYDIKAKSNLACVKSGITRLGDWRRETWQFAAVDSLLCLHPPISLVV